MSELETFLKQAAAVAPKVPKIRTGNVPNPATAPKPAPKAQPTGDGGIIHGVAAGKIPGHMMPPDLAPQVAAAKGNRDGAKLRQQRKNMDPEEYAAGMKGHQSGVKKNVSAAKKDVKGLPKDYDAGAARAAATYDMGNQWHKMAPVAGAALGGLAGAATADENESALGRGLAGAAMGGGLGLGVRHGAPHAITRFLPSLA